MESTSPEPRYHNPIDWLFRNRLTGRFTILQWPNLPLALYLGAVAVRVVFRPTGDTAMVLGAVSAGLLVAWAILEVLRGVNPFRRALGLAAVGMQVGLLLLHL